MKYGKLIYFVTFFAMVVQAPFFLYEKPDELMFIPLILIFGLGAIFFLSKNPDREDADFQINIFLIAFTIRIWVGFIIYGLDYSAATGDEDTSGYMTGWYVAENWYKNGIDGVFTDIYRVFVDKQNLGQSMLWGMFMFVAGGPSRLIVSIINSFAGSILVIVVYRLAKKLFDFQTAKVAAILLTFWFSLIVLSAGTSKEILVICLEWAILYLAVRNQRKLTQKDLFSVAPLMLVLYTVRFYAFYICAAALFFRAIISNKKHFVRNSILGFLLVASLMMILNASGSLSRDYTQLDEKNQSVDSWRKTTAATTGSGVNVYSEYKGSPAAIPVATIYFFFAPFPWQMFEGSLRNSFAAVENMALIILFIIGLPAIKIFFKERFYQVLPILVFCTLYAGFQIWGLSNLGLAWRHKQTIMPLFFLLVALSLTKNFRKNLFPVK